MAVADRQFGYQVGTLKVGDVSFVLRYKTIDINMTAQMMESIAAKDRNTFAGYTANRVKSRAFTIDISGVVEALDTITHSGTGTEDVGIFPFVAEDDMSDKSVSLICPFITVSGNAVVTGGEENFPGEAAEGMIRLKFTSVPTFSNGA